VFVSGFGEMFWFTSHTYARQLPEQPFAPVAVLLTMEQVLIAADHRLRLYTSADSGRTLRVHDYLGRRDGSADVRIVAGRGMAYVHSGTRGAPASLFAGANPYLRFHELPPLPAGAPQGANLLWEGAEGLVLDFAAPQFYTLARGAGAWEARAKPAPDCVQWLEASADGTKLQTPCGRGAYASGDMGRSWRGI